LILTSTSPGKLGLKSKLKLLDMETGVYTGQMPFRLCNQPQSKLKLD